jgi:hypothetical protein
VALDEEDDVCSGEVQRMSRDVPRHLHDVLTLAVPGVLVRTVGRPLSSAVRTPARCDSIFLGITSLSNIALTRGLAVHPGSRGMLRLSQIHFIVLSNAFKASLTAGLYCPLL